MANMMDLPVVIPDEPRDLDISVSSVMFFVISILSTSSERLNRVISCAHGFAFFFSATRNAFIHRNTTVTSIAS